MQTGHPSPEAADGGCQCGAVRYRVALPFVDPHVCHCRMCQRAVGAPFAALAGVPHDRFAWTRGTPGLFASSAVAERMFCRDCGTPLGFAYVGGQTMNVTMASLDDPASVVPLRQYGVEGRLAWTCTLSDLPASRTEDDFAPGKAPAQSSRQFDPLQPPL